MNTLNSNKYKNKYVSLVSSSLLLLMTQGCIDEVAAIEEGAETNVSDQLIVRTSDELVLHQEETVVYGSSNMEVDYYRNQAYQCGSEGDYGFLVVNPRNNPDASAPLWVYLHGGNQSTNQSTDYDPNVDTWNHENTYEELWGTFESQLVDDNGLKDNTLKRRMEEGYRILMLSTCDTSWYWNAEENGNYGLQATMAAVDYAAEQYATSYVWAHGTEAGSLGAWKLASSYKFEGNPITGVIEDSGGLNASMDAEIAEHVSDVQLQVGEQDLRETAVLWLVNQSDAEATDAFSGVTQAIDDQENSPHEIHFLDGLVFVPTLADQHSANDLVDTFIDGVLADTPPHFGDESGEGYNTVFIGHSFFIPVANGLPFHTQEVNIEGHVQSTEFSGGSTGAPLALWQDDEHRENIQAMLDTGTVELFGMTFEGTYPTLEGYELWIDYALSKNPNTKIMLGLPWNDYPTDYANAEEYSELWHSGRDNDWLVLIDSLRAMYPGVEIFSVPYGQAAVELRNMLEAGDIPGMTELQGSNPDTSLFRDYKGHGHEDGILMDLAELVWLSAIYGVDLNTYEYVSDHSIDLKVIAQKILDDQNPNYKMSR